MRELESPKFKTEKELERDQLSVGRGAFMNMLTESLKGDK